jgi:galactofuranosylgalactofuranosylrhamnosyl-N-acetylglucosaminyl-diphospho-decaprenol beta-1,5/1,6-galactofuranosyltransferase
MKCLNQEGFFYRGSLYSDTDPEKESEISVVICTYKKEKFILKNLAELKKAQDELLNLKVYIIDNGNTLNNLNKESEGIYVIPNKNTGGSGGFSRGMHEALSKSNATHLLLLDDDIEFHSEMIIRMQSCMSYADDKTAFCGYMLDYYNKTSLFEAGSDYNYSAIKPILHLNGLEITKSESLNFLAKSYYPDYGPWYCFGIPTECLKKTGYSLPIFVRFDDIEFGIRLKKMGMKTLVNRSTAVWHEPSYSKNNPQFAYYRIRNGLIVNHIYGHNFLFRNILYILYNGLGSLLIRDYARTECMILGLIDFLKGPEFIQFSDPEEIHHAVGSISKNLSHSAEHNCSVQHELYPKKPKFLQKLIFFLTLNGYLLPDIILSKQKAVYEYKDLVEKTNQIAPFFWKYKIIEENNRYNQTTIIRNLNRTKAFTQIATLSWNIIKILFKSKSLQKSWKNSYINLSSQKTWETLFSASTIGTN